MPRRPKSYLVHDLCDLTQTVICGQRGLIAFIRNEMGCKVNNTKLNHLTDEDNMCEVQMRSREGHEIRVEGLFD